jgi:NAD(P)-dependent dehydrogenase (short-subunit alcohol dehydrogenase family)
MKGKTVVITGGTSGIGEIAAERLAQMGARIVLIARSKSRGKVSLMAYFVITEGLRERLLASAPARIVSTASAAHQGVRLDFDDLQSAKGFGAMKGPMCGT